jgi:3-hydroxybutyryl-CoA dehydrogenase
MTTPDTPSFDSQQHTPRRDMVIVGGGVMGGDIAVIFAAAGWKVHVMSPSLKTRNALGARVSAGLAKLGAPASNAAGVATYAALGDIDWRGIELVIEAATEDIALKRRIFAELERLARPEIALATNTSNFRVGEVSMGLRTASRVAGLHFFMPAHLVPLVEVVSAEATDPAIAEGLVVLMRQLAKAPIWVKKDVPGFVGNRLQHSMLREALYLIADGVVSADDVDTAVRYGFGFRFIACGPILQKEMSGWDTSLLIATGLYPHLHDENGPPALLREMVLAGRTGMKAKRGFWEWTDESIAKEKARIEKALQAGFRILEDR